MNQLVKLAIGIAVGCACATSSFATDKGLQPPTTSSPDAAIDAFALSMIGMRDGNMIGAGNGVPYAVRKQSTGTYILTKLPGVPADLNSGGLPVMTFTITEARPCVFTVTTEGVQGNPSPIAIDASKIESIRYSASNRVDDMAVLYETHLQATGPGVDRSLLGNHLIVSGLGAGALEEGFGQLRSFCPGSGQ